MIENGAFYEKLQHFCYAPNTSLSVEGTPSMCFVVSPFDSVRSVLRFIFITVLFFL